MSIEKNIADNLWGHSAAMYSTWLYCKPFRALFDCGEGVSVAMRNHVFGVETVFLTHPHYDHVGGLPGLVHSRASARGDKGKPMLVCHPAARGFEDMKAFIASSSPHLSYDLEYRVVSGGDEVWVGKKHCVAPFEVSHGRCPAVGYVVRESRTRLRQGLAGMSEAEIAALAKRDGAAAVREQYSHPVMAYCGDCSPVDPARVMGVDLLVHEGTFLREEDRDDPGHSSVAEAVRAAVAAKVGTLILSHVSGRYLAKDVYAGVVEAVAKEGFSGGVFLLWGDEIKRVDLP